MLQNDSLSRVLFIDLSRRQSRVEDRRGLFEKSLGGAGVAVELLAEQCPKGADPLGPDNPIVLAVGPLTGLFPLASKTVAMFKSPHTGNLGESHAGGRSAVALRSSGYGAIVITGASPSPVYLVVDEERVHFRDASSLWGVTSRFTVGRILRDRERSAGFTLPVEIVMMSNARNASFDQEFDDGNSQRDVHRDRQGIFGDQQVQLQFLLAFVELLLQPPS